MKRIFSAVVAAVLLLPVAALAVGADDTEFMFIKHLPGFVPSGYVDQSGPQAVSRAPANGATGVSTGALLSLTFDENVQKGSGEIVIEAGGLEFGRIAVSSGNVSVSGKEASINPASDFARGETYSVSVPAGAFVDVRGNASAAVSGWSFATVENGAPNITSSAITSVMEGTPYSYFATAEDAEGDALSFSFGGIQPAWLTLDDHGNGTATLSGMPQDTDVGEHPIILVVSDGSRTAQQEFTIAVAANGTPIFTSAAITGSREGELYSYSAIAEDSPGDTLDITAETLPAWLSFTPDNINRTALIEGTPTETEVGSHDVVLRVSDGLKSSTQEFSITVAANEHPAWASPAEGSLGTVLVDEAITPITFMADDTDTPVTYSADMKSLPPGLALNGDTLEGTPTTTDSYDFTVTATDSLGTSSDRAFSMVVQDTTPDAFSFTDVADAPLGALQTSDEVVITGITGDVDISIAGGSYSIDGGSYTTAAGTITSGQTVALQQTSSASLNTTTTTTLTVGTVSADWMVTTIADCTATPGDVCPDGTVYAGTTPDGNVPMYVTRCDVGMSWDGTACTGTRSVITWNNGTGNWTVTGINNTATGKTNTATLAEFSDAGQPYQAARTCQDLDLHGQSDWYLPAKAELNVLYMNRMEIGGFDVSGVLPPGYYWSSTECNDNSPYYNRFSDGYQGNSYKYSGFSIRCARGGAGGDTTPDAFSFTALTGQSLSTAATSNTVTINGIASSVPVTITGGTFSIQGGAYATTGNIANGQTLTLKQTTSASYNTLTTASVTVGTSTVAWTATTAAQDTTPDAFSFTAVTGAPLSTLQTSSTATITGITGNVPISITGGSYRIGVGSYTASAGTIASGQTVALQQTSSASLNTTTTATLTVGNAVVNWTVTTLAGCTDSPGTVCADGSVYAGVTPDGNLPMYVTRCDAGMSWDGSACSGTRSGISWNNGTENWVTTGVTNAITGKTNTATLVGLTDLESPHLAAKYCQDLVVHGQSDWYLPALNELNVIYTNHVVIDGFDIGGVPPMGFYWSSSEDNTNLAWPLRFSDGYLSNAYKYGVLSVRCARGGVGNDTQLAAFTFAVPATPVNYGATATLTGTVESGATVAISGAATGNATVTGSSWSFTTPALTTAGTNTFTATATDAANNTAAASQSVTVIYPQTCKALKTAYPPAASGIHTIDPDGGGAIAAFQVYCDMITSGGGWTVVGMSKTPSTWNVNNQYGLSHYDYWIDADNYTVDAKKVLQGAANASWTWRAYDPVNAADMDVRYSISRAAYLAMDLDSTVDYELSPHLSEAPLSGWVINLSVKNYGCGATQGGLPLRMLERDDYATPYCAGTANGKTTKSAVNLTSGPDTYAHVSVCSNGLMGYTWPSVCVESNTSDAGRRVAVAVREE